MGQPLICCRFLLNRPCTSSARGCTCSSGWFASTGLKLAIFFSYYLVYTRDWTWSCRVCTVKDLGKSVRAIDFLSRVASSGIQSKVDQVTIFFLGYLIQLFERW